MARNSRFRTTSGPSSNRPHADKRKPFKKNTRATSGPRGEFSKPQGGSNYSEHKASARPFGGKGEPFQKRNWRDKDSFSTRSRDEKKPKEFIERKSRPFSKGPFRKRPDGPGGFDENRTGPGKPRERKFFVESRLDRHRKASAIVENVPASLKDDLIRLNKFISNSGVCSRREADDLITMGLITVNGKSITALGCKVKLTDDVRYEGKRLKAEKPVYILLNKPKGFITTTDDPQERNTVMQLIQGACKERVYPVGRLDRNTSGLLLLTNDGDLTEKLTHPSHNVKKIYRAELSRSLTKNDFQKIVDGVRLEEGKAMVDDLAIVSEDGKAVGLEIHIGWNRIVRRIFEALDYEVLKLDRSVYATLDKKDLSRGHWRFLRQDEVIRLKHFQ